MPENHFPDKVSYELNDVFRDLLIFAHSHLRPGSEDFFILLKNSNKFLYRACSNTRKFRFDEEIREPLRNILTKKINNFNSWGLKIS